MLLKDSAMLLKDSAMYHFIIILKKEKLLHHLRKLDSNIRVIIIPTLPSCAQFQRQRIAINCKFRQDKKGMYMYIKMYFDGGVRPRSDKH